jgi:hypothetical protein
VTDRARRAELLLLPDDLFARRGRRSPVHKSRQNRLVPDMPASPSESGVALLRGPCDKRVRSRGSERTLAG